MRNEPALSFVVIVLIIFSSVLIISDVTDGSRTYSSDFEEDDGGLLHGGRGDLWMWGVPGPYDPGNPGPAGAGQGEKVWGCPLNGSYENGTDAYLEIPEYDASGIGEIHMSFLYWYDLSRSSHENNETGMVHEGDVCILQLNQGEGWEVLKIYNGTSTVSWREEDLSLSEHADGPLRFRFLLKDNNDGFTDNGFFIDKVEITGEDIPEVSLTLGTDTMIPSVVVTGERVKIIYGTINEGKTVPPATYVSIYIESSGQQPQFYRRMNITMDSPPLGVEEWFPSSTGSFRGWINLTIGGVYSEGRSFNIRSYSAIYYDDASSGVSYWTVENGDVTAGWNTMNPPDRALSMSSGKVFWYGSRTGGPNGSEGFQGPVWSYMESDWIDLTYYKNSYLFIYHKFSFLGPMGSSGGIVEALKPGGTWEVLEPIDFSSEPLRDNVSGPLGGSEAIVGSGDWSVLEFGMNSFTGGRTRIRFSVSADSSGWGEGWFIDDVMVVGEGYDPFDKEPPAPIEGLDVQVVDEGAVTVSWYPSNARDFRSYHVYLENYEYSDISSLEPFRVLNMSDQDSIVITDLDPEVKQWIAVTAVDLAGNEITNVQPVLFRPTRIDHNRPPSAIIKVIGGKSILPLGEDIIFDGTGSSDPDGDPLTYKWTMPDGSIRRGSTVTWRSESVGKDLVVTLVVMDDSGASDSDAVTIDIVDDGGSIYHHGDLLPFLVIVIPLVIILLLIVIAAAFFRKNTRKRLEKRLAKIGIGLDRFPAGGQVPVLSRRSQAGRVVVSPKVHDLVPVKREEKEDEISVMEPAEWKDSPLRGRNEITGMGVKRKSMKREGNLVRVVIECPFCGKTFRERVDRTILDEGQDLSVKCPHCGRSGEITP